MFDAGSPLPGLLLAAMIFLVLALLPYTDAGPSHAREDEPSAEETRLRARAAKKSKERL
jgi:hypothetical protein